MEHGVLRPGVYRELVIEGLEETEVLESYTVKEAAEALGRTYLTVRSWIEKGILPEPFTKEVSRGFKNFTRFELDVVAEILADHETHSQYVSTANVELITDIQNCIRAVREGFLDGDMG